MLERMPSSGLTRWLAYDRVEPFGEWRADLRTGILASIFANVHRDPRRTPQAYVPADFMPRFAGIAKLAGDGLARIQAGFDALVKRSQAK